MEPYQDQAIQPQPPVRSRSFSLRILLAAIAIVAIGGYVFFRLSSPRITGLEVALKTASFLDKTLQPDGSFTSGFICGDSIPGKCEPANDTPVHTGQAILAYYFLAEATDDQSFMVKADKAMNFVLDRCESDLEFCEWNYFSITQYYEDTQEDKYLQAMLRPAEKFLSMLNEEAVLSQVGTKLAGLFNATGDVRYKNRLLEIADLELLTQANNTGRADYNMQLAWSVYLPAYQISNDQKYLAVAEEFFGNLKAVENLDKFDQAYSMSKAASVLLDLEEVTGKEIYRLQAHTIMQEVLLQFWDTSENPKFTGDYGFVDSSDTRLEPGQSTKYMLFSGGIMQQFIKLKSEKFKLR